MVITKDFSFVSKKTKDARIEIAIYPDKKEDPRMAFRKPGNMEEFRIYSMRCVPLSPGSGHQFNGRMSFPDLRREGGVTLEGGVALTCFAFPHRKVTLMRWVLPRFLNGT